MLISSDAGEPYEQLLQPAPFFHVQTLHLGNGELRFEWDSPHAATLSEYTLSLLHPDSESSYVLAEPSLSLNRKDLAPGTYKWAVSALRNGEGFPSDTLNFEPLPLSVTVNQLEISQQVMDYDTLIFASIELVKHESLHILQITGIDLYGFHFLVQWMQEEFKGSKNFGFAKHGNFSFFCTCDKKTLNNLIGKTPDREQYSFSLTNPQNEHLAINNSIDFRKRYTTNFFNQLIKNSQQVKQ